MASPGWGSPGRGCQLLPSRLQFVVRAPRLLLRNSAKGPVSRILSCAVIPLGAALPRTLISDLPGGFGNSSRHPSDEDLSPGTPPEPPGRIGPMRSAAWLLSGASLPIWSCSVWGLPCPDPYRPSGALLPHHFTLTPALAVQANLQPFGPVALPKEGVAEAVSFLWHWPSAGLEAHIPDVIRHTALRSSDFPPPVDIACAKPPAATARSSCQWLVYRSCGLPALSLSWTAARPSPSCRRNSGCRW